MKIIIHRARFISLMLELVPIHSKRNSIGPPNLSYMEWNLTLMYAVAVTVCDTVAEFGRNLMT